MGKKMVALGISLLALAAGCQKYRDQNASPSGTASPIHSTSAAPPAEPMGRGTGQAVPPTQEPGRNTGGAGGDVRELEPAEKTGTGSTLPAEVQPQGAKGGAAKDGGK